MIRGREKFHGQRARRLILAEQFWRGARQGAIGFSQPARFIDIAHDWGAPIGGDFQLRKRAFDADFASIGQGKVPYVR